jgi:hypothetical protein
MKFNNDESMCFLGLLSSYAHAKWDENTKQALYLSEFNNKKTRLAHCIRLIENITIQRIFKCSGWRRSMLKHASN